MISRQMERRADSGKGPVFRAHRRSRISCSRWGLKMELLSSALMRPTSLLKVERSFKRSRSLESISSMRALVLDKSSSLDREGADSCCAMKLNLGDLFLDAHAEVPACLVDAAEYLVSGL